MSRCLSSHQSQKAASYEWLTPPELLHALGAFDLDPCAPLIRPWDTACNHYTMADDGLKMPWVGRVWCNPPFGKYASAWVKRMCEHGNGIVLVPARTETKMFFEYVWGSASGVLFLRSRPHFHYVDGRRAQFNSGAPIALIGYGANNLAALINSGLGAVTVVVGGESAP